jgi:hypothetical protein
MERIKKSYRGITNKETLLNAIKNKTDQTPHNPHSQKSHKINPRTT